MIGKAVVPNGGKVTLWNIVFCGLWEEEEVEGRVAHYG